MIKKTELLNAVHASMSSLRRDLDDHQQLLSAVLEDKPQVTTAQHGQKDLRLNQREKLYRATISHAIQILEESRKSFKSKQLGALRKQLINVLIDD